MGIRSELIDWLGVIQWVHMNDTQYIPVQGRGMRSFIFQAELEQDSDGRWSAWIDSLSGCATWGYTKREALDALRDVAQSYVEVLLEKGGRVPVDGGVETVNMPVVSVSV